VEDERTKIGTGVNRSLAPSTKDKAAILAGTPVAIVGVLLWEDHFHVKLDTTAAVAVGGLFATVMGYCWHVVTTLIDRWIERSSM
jgi:hypothetical protein